MKSSEASEAEKKVQRDVFAFGVKLNIFTETLLKKFDLYKVLRVMSYIVRFVKRCQHKKVFAGAISTVEIENQERFFVKEAQQQAIESSNFAEKKEYCDWN